MTARRGPGLTQRCRELLLAAGIDGVTPGQLLAVCIGVGVAAAALVYTVSLTVPIAVAFGGIAAYAPFALVRRRAHGRREELRELWPEAVDNLSSAVRAGLSLPEAVSALGDRGPEQLRPYFARFAEDWRATGSFPDSMRALQQSLADPVADRIVEALLLAREVGGSDLGRLLRTLSTFLREDARTRAELRTRQGWTVNAARLGLAAPWVVLLLLATQSSTVQAYNSGSGVLVLAFGGVVSAVAYQMMRRIGRLPAVRRAQP